MELLIAAFILASLSPQAHAGVIGLREAPTNNSSLPSCPAVDGDFPVFHPHPTNCSLFYQCWQGHPFLYSCPAGLYWDQQLSTCNWPSQVECHLNESTEEPSTDDPSIENTTAEDGNEKWALENSILPSCPSSADPVYFPHPSNCSLFYECSNGIPYLMSCPAGLYFDPINRVCNYPNQVTCNASDETTKNPTEEPIASTENTSSNKTHHSNVIEFYESLPICPDIDGNMSIYFPHPQNCSLFYECSNGIAYLFSCPEGLYFDPTLNVCNSPGQVTCNVSNKTTQKPTEESSKPTEIPSVNKTYHNNVIQSDKPFPTCPDIDGTMSVYFPHPQNCSLFYECSNGIPYLFSCPDGLFFDPTLNICNSPSQVACNVNNETTQKPTEESSKPTEKPLKPTEEPLKPTEEPSKPTDEPLKTTEEPSKPTEEPSKPTDELLKTTEEPSKSTEEPSKPTEDPSKPIELPSTPTEELSKTTEKSVEEPYEPIKKEGSGLLSRVW